MDTTMEKARKEYLHIENALSAAADYANVENGEAEIIKQMISKKKKDLVETLYRQSHPKIKEELFKKNNGYYKSWNPLFYGKTEEELITKLYDYYFRKDCDTVFYNWIGECIKDNSVSPKTIIEYENEWKALKKDALFRKDITEITKADIKHLFQRMTGQGLITKKDFTNKKSVLNGLFGHASENDLIPFNPVKEVKTKNLKYKTTDPKKKSYTVFERQHMIQSLKALPEQTGYILGIRFALEIPLRFGEIRGIKYADVDFQRHTIKIMRQVQNTREVSVNMDTLTVMKEKRHLAEKDPKGNVKYSIREVPLTVEAEAVINEAHRLNPSGEYLFMEYGRPLNNDTFNDWLKHYETAAGLCYLSSHKLRFTVACRLFNGGKGMDVKMIQRILGHSNLAMTLHYLEADEGDDISELRDEMNQLLSFN